MNCFFASFSKTNQKSSYCYKSNNDIQTTATTIIILSTITSDVVFIIKKVIISSLELEDIKPEDIVDSEPLFGEGLGLDSIDALELGVALKKKFGIKFSSDNAENRKHFASVNALAEYINSTKN